MKNLINFTLILSMFIALSMTSCVKDNDDLVASILISPSDAITLSRLIGLPSGSIIRNGGFPLPGNSSFNCSAFINQITSSNGSTTPIVLQCSGFQNGVIRLYVQVVGSNIYYEIPVTNFQNGIVNIPLTLPTNLLGGNFCVNVIAVDSNGNSSTLANQCVDVLRLGTGSLQMSLSWNNYSDTDLHVIDANGEEIYYKQKTSTTGGVLDRDDVDGFGPENIFWLETAPDGEYKVLVNLYDGAMTSPYYITVSSNGVSKAFDGIVEYGSKKLVTTITKQGDRISFN